MGINLQKGQKIELTKGGTGLQKVMVGLGWDEAPRTGGFFGFGAPQPIDCDASVILCGENGKTVGIGINDFCVYYGNLAHSSRAIIHQGDNLTGEGDGDDEQIMVQLDKVPSNIAKMVFVVNIYEAASRNQHFGMIKNAFIRLVNMANNQEICRFNLSENYNNMSGLIVGEIYRRNGEWKFNAIGQAIRDASRVDAIIRMYR